MPLTNLIRTAIEIQFVHHTGINIMEENDQSQNIPLLCRKGCGFYGSPNFDGFCSKCHRSMQVQAENVQAVSRVTSDFEDKLSPERSVKITASSGNICFCSGFWVTDGPLICSYIFKTYSVS